MPYILQTNHLTKTIGGKELISNVNLHITKGEIYGFLGPNGAGKTTVMKLITNLWKPTDGSIEIFGSILTPQSYEVLKRMGSIIEYPTFYDHLSGYENLKLHCEYMGYYNHRSIENSLEMLELDTAAEKPVKNYSLGMKERLGIARAVLCKPELLISQMAEDCQICCYCFYKFHRPIYWFGYEIIQGDNHFFFPPDHSDTGKYWRFYNV